MGAVHPVNSYRMITGIKRKQEEKHKTLFISLMMVMLAVIVAGCGSNTQGQATLGKNTVIIEDAAFQPDELTINKGEAITWINQDSMDHTVTGESFDSGILDKDAEYRFTFSEAGTFDYTCTLHPYMTGRVIVKQTQ